MPFSTPIQKFTDFDVSLFQAGKHFQLYKKFGSHIVEHAGDQGVAFAVFAPGAHKVEVIGDFNYWSGENHPLYVRWDGSGIWEGFIPGLKKGQIYKYKIYSNHDDRIREKADPYALHTEQMPKTASVIWDTDFEWSDKDRVKKRRAKNANDAPISIYEMHFGSWAKKDGMSLSYREIAPKLIDHLTKTGFTHVEFLPLTEHPFYPSWGYLSTSYFAPTSRFGTPQDLMYLIEKLHDADIGVIMDWVPAHFPSDEFALADFDGTALYEHPDRKKGFHPDWNSLIFNFERPEIRSFLISSAHFWFEKFQLDGLRVDAVSSMIYLDYSREADEWEPNQYGGNEYLAAIDFLKELNISCYGRFEGIQMIAEESTAFHGVTKPVHDGGLGFGMKWMMGWMNDTLRFFEHEPIHRAYHHNEISFSMAYYYSEQFLLALSHDEVVHGKKSLIYKMPGDSWQQFANLRLLYAYMFTHPGNKLLFMGCEFGQTSEWNVDESLDWHLLDYAPHQGIQECVADLNGFYKKEKALYKNNYDYSGFEWLDHSDSQNGVISYLRKAGDEMLLVVCHFTPEVRHNYRIGIPGGSKWELIFNSDDEKYGGSQLKLPETYEVSEKGWQGRDASVVLTLPPLAGIVLRMIP